MKAKYLFSIVLLFLFASPIKAQIFQWAKHIKSHSPRGPGSIHLDSQKNIYIQGGIRGRVDMDPGPDSSFLGMPGFENKSYILKLDSLGDFLWVQEQIGQAGQMCMGKNDTYCVVGTFEDTTDFDPGPDSLKLSPSGPNDMFIQNFAPTGTPNWLKIIGKPGGGLIPSSIVLDKQHNLYIAGRFWNSMDFDPGPDSALLSTSQAVSHFLLKLDSLGNFLWANKLEINDTSFLSIEDIHVDNQGNLYATGYFDGRLDFDPGPDSTYLEAQQTREHNTFITKFDTRGNFQWVRKNNLYESLGREIALDNFGNVYIIGGFSTAWNSAPYVMKLDSTGQVLWSHTYATSYGALAYSIALDEQHNIYIGGNFVGLETNFNPSTGVFYLTPSFMAAYSDIYVLKLDENGNFIYAFNFVGKGEEDVLDITIDEQGFLYMFGGFTDSVDFDPSLQSFVLEATMNQQLRAESYILKLDGKKSVGIESFEVVDVKLYPNPSRGIFNVDLPANVSIAQMQIMDALGNQVHSESLTLQHNFIDLKQLPSGIYFVRVDLNTGPRAVGKIILTD